MRTLVVCSLALTAFVSGTLAASQKYDLDVVTSDGKITGHIAPGMRNTVEYLGIPYARPPVGELRFAAPMPLERKSDYVAEEWVRFVISDQWLVCRMLMIGCRASMSIDPMRQLGWRPARCSLTTYCQ
jgi:hypothetical protein